MLAQQFGIGLETIILSHDLILVDLQLILWETLWNNKISPLLEAVGVQIAGLFLLYV